MAYTAWSVSFGEQPSTAKWNILGENDASFNDGTGIGGSAVKGESLGTPVAFGAYLSGGDQSIPNSTFTKVTMNTEEYDLGSNFNTTSNDFTAPYDGIYQFSLGIYYTGGIGDGTRYIGLIYKNGSEEKRPTMTVSGGNDNVTANGTSIMKLSANDVITIYTWQNSGGSESLSAGATDTWFNGALIGRT